MTRRICLTLACALVIVVSGEAASAQGIITGIVRDDSLAQPLAGADLLIPGTSYRATSNEAGRFQLDGLPPAQYDLIVRLVGYLPLRISVLVRDAQTVRVNPVLTRSVAVLDPLEVTSTGPRPMTVREGIADRQRLGFGYILDSTFLRTQEHRRLDQVFGAIPGMRIVAARECTGPNSCGPVEYRAVGRSGCYMSVFLDGLTFWKPDGTGSRPPPDFRRMFETHALEAVEVYRSSSEIPPEFGGAASACGVVALWSRR